MVWSFWRPGNTENAMLEVGDSLRRVRGRSSGGRAGKRGEVLRRARGEARAKKGALLRRAQVGS